MFKSLIAATAAVGFAALMPAATGRSRSWIRGRRRSRRGRDYSRQRALRPAKSMSFRHRRHRRHHRRAWVIVEPDAK